MITTDQARAQQQHFGDRTGAGERPSLVSIVGDLRDGPYFPFERWEASAIVLAPGAFYSMIMVYNQITSTSAIKPATQNRIMVIDFLAVQIGAAAASVFVDLLNPTNAASGFSYAGIYRRRNINASDGINPSIGDAVLGTRNNSAALFDATAPVRRYMGDTLEHRLDGPWALDEGCGLLVTSGTTNVDLRVYASGRFYRPQ